MFLSCGNFTLEFILFYFILFYFDIWKRWSLELKAWLMKVTFDSVPYYECLNVLCEMCFLIILVLDENLNFYSRVWFIELGCYCNKFITLRNGWILYFIAGWMTFRKRLMFQLYLDKLIYFFWFWFYSICFGQSLLVTCSNIVLNGQAEYCLNGVVMVQVSFSWVQWCCLCDWVVLHS